MRGIYFQVTEDKASESNTLIARKQLVGFSQQGYPNTNPKDVCVGIPKQSGLLGGPWDFVTTYNRAYNPSPKSACRGCPYYM